MMQSQSENMLLVIQAFALERQITSNFWIDKFLKHLGFADLPMTSGLSFSPMELHANKTRNLIS